MNVSFLVRRGGLILNNVEQENSEDSKKDSKVKIPAQTPKNKKDEEDKSLKTKPKAVPATPSKI
jgi:hypothetical protein